MRSSFRESYVEAQLPYGIAFSSNILSLLIPGSFTFHQAD